MLELGACGGIRFTTPAGKDRTPHTGGACPHVGVDAAPVWSPDGKQIAMAQLRAGTYVMNADGSELHRAGPAPEGIPALFVPRALSRPAWRPAPHS